MEAFRGLPQHQEKQARYVLLAMAALFGPILLAMLILTLVPAWRTGAVGAAVTLPLIALGFTLSFRLVGPLQFAFQRRQRQLDDTALKHKEGHYVGVAYGDRLWSFRQDTAWDRGYLHGEDGLLVFEGYGPGFKLPVGLIHSVRLVERQMFVGKLQFIFVRWSEVGWPENTLILQIRDARNIRDLRNKTYDLRMWLDAQISGAEFGRHDSDALPMATSRLDFSAVASRETIQPADRRVAFLTGVGCWLVTIVLSIAVSIPFHKPLVQYFAAPAAMAGLIGYQMTVMKRVRNRAINRKATPS